MALKVDGILNRSFNIFRLDHADKRQITVFFIKIQTITEDKFILDVKTDVIYRNIYHPSARFVEECTEGQTSGVAGLQYVHDESKSLTAVNDVFYNEDVPSGYFRF